MTKVWVYKGEWRMIEEWSKKYKKYSKLAKTSFFKRPTLKQKLAKFIALYYDLCIDIATEKIKMREIPDNFEDLPLLEQIKLMRTGLQLFDHPIFKFLSKIRLLEKEVDSDD